MERENQNPPPWTAEAGSIGGLACNSKETISPNGAKSKAAHVAAIDFLQRLRPGGPWVLTAIVPDGGTTTITAHDERAVDDFITKYNGQRNIYYSVNPTRGPMGSKAKKTDIAAIEFIHADCDPKDDETPEDAKARYLAALNESGLPEPTFIIDSGNGAQFLWRLKQPIALRAPMQADGSTNGKSVLKYDEKNQALIDDIEARIKHATGNLGASTDGTQNIDRILRTPGTVNLPNKKKLKLGRTQCPSELLAFNDNATPLDAFPPPPAATANPKLSAGKSKGGSTGARRTVGIDDLSVSDHVKVIIKTGVDPDGPPGDRSAATWVCMLALAAAGYDDAQLEAIFLDPDIPISGHILDQTDPKGKLAQQIAKARAQTLDPDVARMNESYAVVLLRNKIAFLKSDEPTLTLMNTETFVEWNAEHFVTRNGRAIPLTRYWRTHRQKRKYKGVIFAPGREVPGYWNLFKGFPVEPAPGGDFPLFREHLLQNVAGGDRGHYLWIFGWYAQIFQQPEVKLGTALALRGKEGVGKTKVGEIFGHLLGTHYKLVDNPRMVTGQFNSHLAWLLLLQADEAFWAGDHVAEGKVKSLVTSHTQQIEFKGLEPFDVESYLRLMVTGNADWLVPAGPEARRWAVFDVGEGRMQDKKFFAAMDREMENGGYEALMRELMSFDLSQVDLRTVPKTEALREQKIASFRPIESWWLDLLMSGELPWGSDEIGVCPCNRLQTRFQQHARRRGEKARAIATELGMFLNKHAPGLKKRRGAYERFNQKKGCMESVPGNLYHFPSLAICRAKFEKNMKQALNWPMADGDNLEWVTEPPPDQEDILEM